MQLLYVILRKEAPVLLYYCKIFLTKIWWISLVGLPHILFMILNGLKLCLQYVVFSFNLVNVLKFSPIPLNRKSVFFTLIFWYVPKRLEEYSNLWYVD